ncbi:MAG: small-conductance mechanosensitive channel [Parcubacteria group bacterium Gr01-1014_3]|nr:MAG: small-conductance mechanosensitive channel [Parcubacteria group bacterium Gr01-1014_3]
MLIESWVNVLRASLQNLWLTVAGFLPSLMGAILVFIVGLIVAAVLDRVVERLIYYLKVDAVLRKLGVEQYLHRANLTLDSGHFVGKIVYWFFVLAFLLAASDILGFFTLSGFIRDVLSYVPDILVAIMILLSALMIATFLRRLVMASVMSAQIHGAKGLAMVTWWVVMIFGLLTALVQLGVAVNIINTVITGLIAMMAIAGGLAFGLGGKEYASKLLQRVEDEIEHKR